MKVWKTTAVGLSLAAALTVSGCGGDDEGGDGAADASPSGTPVTTADLEGMTYTSTSVTGHDLVAGSKVRVAFESGVMSVAAGCNAMGSDYAVDAGTLAWTGEPHSTMKACSDELMAQDDWLRQAFSDGWTATSDSDSTLTLSQGDVTMELTMATME